MKKRFILFIILFGTGGNVNASDGKDVSGWKAGVARVIITPEQSMWMAGYSGRDHASEGKLHDLMAKALVLEDVKGNKCMLITTDLCAIPKDLSDRIRDKLKERYNLGRSQIIINCSHTHSGPVLQNSIANIYTLDAEQLEKIKNYSAELESLVILLAGNALKAMAPADVFSGNGMAKFQVNRRNNNERSLHLQPELKGPNDFAVPVIKVADKSGRLLAIAFGYACHNTVLSGYQWSGDYAGFAQLELEKLHPGVTALFFQGAGADQNPMPRRTVSLAKQYGKELAYAVDKVLNENMQQLASEFSGSYAEVELPLNTPPTRVEVLKMIEDNASGYKRNSAVSLLKRMDGGETLRKSYPYPVTVWKLGEQVIVALGGELVVHYAIEIKKMYGLATFVMGYSNDVMSYIPSVTILRESADKKEGYAFYNPVNQESMAYEGGLYTQMAYGLPSTWSSNIESVIFSAVQRVAKEAGVLLVEYK